MIGRDHVGQDVPEDDGGVPDPRQPRRLDVGLLADRQHVAARDPGERRHQAHRHRDGDVRHPEAEHGHGGDGEEDHRKREEAVHHPHHDRVEPSPVVAGDEPQAHADDHGGGHRHHAHHQRDARPVEDPAQDVAAEAVGPRPVAGRRALQRPAHALGHRVVGGQRVGEEGHRHHRQEDRQPEHGPPVPREAAPPAAHRAPGLPAGGRGRRRPGRARAVDGRHGGAQVTRIRGFRNA